MQNPEFKLHPSIIYCVFLGLMLAGSGIILALLPFAFWLKALLFAVLCVYGVALFMRFALLRTQQAVIALKKLDGKSWQVVTRARVFDSILRGDSTITTLVSVLRFDVSGLKRPLVCIVFRDSLPADDYRQLVGVIRMG